jgi:peptidoglycan/LPS O-acetylase OafA/YrhL
MATDARDIAGAGRSRTARGSRRAPAPDHAPAPAKHGKRIGALDGLRAFAIAAIVLYHMRPTPLAGGFVGVTLFFVLTGFLVTSGFEREYARTGTFSYGKFLRKRIVRLLPPVAVLVALTALATYLASPSLLPKVQADALPATLFFLNWSYIVNEVSYFNAAGLPSPLTHLWYVALVMQFYVAWPLVLLGLHKATGSKRRVLQATCVLALVSTIVMAVRFDPLADTSRVYYGTDTRLAELLAGAFCALGLSRYKALSNRAARTREPLRVPKRAVAAGGWISLALLAAAAVFADGSSALLYRGGYLVLALLSCTLVAAVQLPGSVLGRILSVKPLEVVGLRSFSVYLVHYPVILLMNPATRTTTLAWWEVLLQLAVVAGVSELFYRFIEVPCQKLGSKAPTAEGAPARKLYKSPWVYACSFAAITIALLVFLPVDWNAAAQRRSEFLRPELAEQAARIEEVVSTTPVISEAEAEALESATKPVPHAEKVPANLDTSGWEYDAETGTTNANVLIIGDSVTEGSTAEIQAVFPEATIDAVIGRQLYVGADVYADHVAAGDTSRAVVMALGGNDTLRSSKFVQELVDAVDGKPVYLVTIRCPYSYQDNNNQVFYDIAAANDNVGIIDWYSYSAGHSEYFWDDGQHLTPTGAAAYAELLKQAFVG